MSFIMIFDKKLHYDASIIGMAVGTILAAGITTIDNASGALEGLANFVNSMPLAEFGFAWLLPGLVGTLIGTLLGKYAGIGKTRDQHDIRSAF